MGSEFYEGSKDKRAKGLKLLHPFGSLNIYIHTEKEKKKRKRKKEREKKKSGSRCRMNK